MIKFFCLFLACILICFGSCKSISAVRENRPYAFLTNSSRYFLLPSEDIEKNIDNYQLVSASYENRDYVLNVWVKADEKGIEMTLMNELGANMGELSYYDGAVSFSSPAFPRSLKGEYVVADFQLCFYNASALCEALADCGLSFEDTGNHRRIFHGKIVIIEIEKNQNTVRLVNHLRGYTYTLEGDF